MGALFVAGMNHRTAPIEVREQLALEEDKLREILAGLAGGATFTEAAILSTCNRVEVYGVAEAPGEARSVAFRHLGAQRGLRLADLEPLLYTHTDEDAVRHVFRVASSLDSMVVGEPQILGQVKDAFALAQSSGTVGSLLHALMAQAFNVAKKVRTETEIGQHAVSVPYAGVELARKIFETLEDKEVLLVGAGEMGELAAKHLVEQGALAVYVANRTSSRAQDLARRLGGAALPYEEMDTAIARVDIVITSTGAPEPIVRVAQVRQALARRPARPLFFIDLGVPRNVEPAVNDIEGVFCYDVDDLRSVVDANMRERQHAAQRAEALVEREVARFTARLRDLEVVPTIISLREKLEAIRRAELEKAVGRLPGVSEETRQVMDALSQAIVNKVLHAPMVKLRDSSREGHGRHWTGMISELFGLRGTRKPEDAR